jgi:hypothetical protein
VLEGAQHGAELARHRLGDSRRGIHRRRSHGSLEDEGCRIGTHVGNDPEIHRDAQAREQLSPGREGGSRGLGRLVAQLGGGEILVRPHAPDDSALLVGGDEHGQPRLCAHARGQVGEQLGRVGNVVAHEDETAQAVGGGVGSQRVLVEARQMHHEHARDLLVERHDAESVVCVLHDRVDGGRLGTR